MSAWKAPDRLIEIRQHCHREGPQAPKDPCICLKIQMQRSFAGLRMIARKVFHQPAKHPERGLLLVMLALAFVAKAYAASPPLPKGLAPPSEGKVAATSRLLSRGEIFQAIHDDLAQRGIPGANALRPQDLRIQLAVPVSVKEAGLKVTQIGFDPIRRETVFELWTSQEPQLLPFHVATRWEPKDPQPGTKQEEGIASAGVEAASEDGRGDLGRWNVISTALPGFRARGPVSASFPLPEKTKPVRPPTLAKPGQPATLVMLGHNLRITTTVIPLDPGSKGQCIRVRDPATDRVMRAEVISEGLLGISF